MANTSYQNKKEESRGEEESIGKTNSEGIKEEKKERNLDKIQKEKEYWMKYAKLMTSKYRDPYLKSPLYHQELKTFKKLINSQKGQKWLDLGCGALPITELILEKSKGEVEIIAGDIHLEPAKKRLQELGSPSSIKLQYIDLSQKLPFPDNFFDGIVSSKVITYIIESQGQKGVEALKVIFQEIYRILKPGGVLIWGTPKKGANPSITAISFLGYILNPYQWIKQKCFLPIAAMKFVSFFKLTQKKEKFGVYTYLFQHEYENLFKQIGFISLKWETTEGGQILINKAIKPL